MIADAKVAQNLPENAVSLFFKGWKEKDWKLMADNCQLSWAATQENPELSLKGLCQVKIISYEILEVIPVGPVSAKVETNLVISIARGIRKEITVEPMVICEAAPLVPSLEGCWGLNPVSFFVG